MLTELTISGAEAVVMHAVHWLKLIVEAVGALVIGAGLLAAVAAWIRAIRARSKDVFSETRLTFARYLALALELQLGADILSTAVSPNMGSDRQTGRNRRHTYSAELLSIA